MPPTSRAPLSDAVIIAVAQLVDDAQCETREPSHSDLDYEMNRAGITAGDPKAKGLAAGKAKRVRAALSWALENRPEAGEVFVANLVAHIRALGGFRSSSHNFCGNHAIRNAIDVFQRDGFELTPEGELRSVLLDNLTGTALTNALESYVRRAKRGVADAALVTGTGKDLLEATAAHVVRTRFGSYPVHANFPTLLGQAFLAVGLATPADQPQPGEPAQKQMERSLYEAACAVNKLRNREGTGHGRPWLPTVSQPDAKAAIEIMGVVAERLLAALTGSPN